MKRLVFSLMFSILSLAQAANTFSDNLKDREVLDSEKSKSAPYKWIGKLITPDGKVCTATLVDINMLLTAAHCLKSPNDLSVVSGVYSLKLPGHETILIDMERSKYFWNLTENSILILDGKTIIKDSEDFVFLMFDRPTREGFGHFDVNTTNKFLVNQRVYNIAGYGKAHNLQFSALSGCSIRTIHDGIAYHDCDASRGDSGAPIFRKKSDGGYVIDAIHTSEIVDANGNPYVKAVYSIETANMGSLATQFGPLYKTMVSDITPKIESRQSSSYPISELVDFPSSKSGKMCYIQCSEGASRIPVTLMDFKKSDSFILTDEDCSKKAKLSCAKSSN